MQRPLRTSRNRLQQPISGRCVHLWDWLIPHADNAAETPSAIISRKYPDAINLPWFYLWHGVWFCRLVYLTQKHISM
jgi:hypothetical protein